ncbi:NAD(P)-dependent oxidoreductase [Novosphingobium lindaniclasticum]
MSSPHPTLTCGFIGLGSQGAPIARRMIDAGFETVLWARRPETLEPYQETGARYAGTVEELAGRCEHIGICVVNDNDVRQVCDVILGAARAGTRIAIHSTVHPETVRDLASQAAACGISIIDAPVSGGSPAAEAGVLTLMLGGDARAIELSMPVFRTFGKLIVRLGEVGAGQKVKIINNSLLVANIGLAQAALEAGETLGIDRASLIELLLASSGRSFGLEVRSRMETPAGFRHGGALLRKDLGLLEEVLGEESAPARQLSHAATPFLNEAAQAPA